jgi:lactoylglutathione lyase
MKINHIAIWSKDIEKLRVFYEKYFGAQSNKKYINSIKKFSSYFLSFDNETRLEIMEMDSITESNTVNGKGYFGLTHFAISVGSEERVIELHEQLKADGYTVFSEPRNTGDGYFESVILDPDGNQLEITV